MRVIDARNVHEAYTRGMEMIQTLGVREQTRAGEVLAIQDPVTTVYHRPQERVLMIAQRDANPFFHLMESVWMLAGRRDATWLDTYVRDFSSRFAEDDGDCHGAYGHRWRRHFDMEGGGTPGLPDQIVTVGQMLLEDPTTRRAIIQMWDPVADLGAQKRDLPCNTQIIPRARYDHLDKVWVLDITVVNRSNDAIWGAYGANAVHMSVLHEVLAGLAGMQTGIYRQMSNNLHAYTDVLHRMWPLQTRDPDMYALGHARPTPMIDYSVQSTSAEFRSRAARAAREVLDWSSHFCDNRDNPEFHGRSLSSSDMPSWIRTVVWPMETAHRLWRGGKRAEALAALDSVRASDWQMAARGWMSRRMR